MIILQDPGIRKANFGSTLELLVRGTYTKRDRKVAVLALVLDVNGERQRKRFDVSSIEPGQSVEIEAAYSYTMDPVVPELGPTYQLSLQPGAEMAFLAPTDRFLIVWLGECNCRAAEWPADWRFNALVPPDVRITVVNDSDEEKQLRVTEIFARSMEQLEAKLIAREKDSDGNLLHRSTATITIYKPIEQQQQA